MKLNILCTSLLLFYSFSFPAIHADEANDGVILAIANEVIPVGKRLTVDAGSTLENGIMNLKMPEQRIQGTMRYKETEKRHMDAIAEAKYRCLVTKGRTTEEVQIMGDRKPEEEEINAIENVPLIAERQEDGKWKVTLEKGDATEEMNKEIKKLQKHLERDSNAIVYGTVKRKVGDEWEVKDGSAIGIMNSEGKISLKFEDIVDFNGMRCAKLIGKVDMTGNPDEEEENVKNAKIRMTGDLVILRSIEHRVDVSFKVNGKMEMSGTVDGVDGGKMEMNVEGDMSIFGSEKIVEAK